MQQTDKYQLNLIETSDTFSPAPLNDNAQKLEAALQSGLGGEAAARAAADAALDARVTVLEQPRIACGKFVGDISSGNNQDIPLPFQPQVVIVFFRGKSYEYMGAITMIASEGMGVSGGIIPGGFQVSCNSGNRGIMNNPGDTYYFLALA